MSTRSPWPLAVVGMLAAAAAAGGAPKAAPATAPAPRRVTRTQPRERCVVGTYRLFGEKGKPATDVHVYFSLPQNEPSQEILELRFVPEPKEILTDKHGRRLAHYVLPRIEPGRHVAVRWIARVRT